MRHREPLPDWLRSAPTRKLLLAWNLFAENTSSSGLDQQEVLGESPFLIGWESSEADQCQCCRGLAADPTSQGRELPVELRPHARRQAELDRRYCSYTALTVGGSVTLCCNVTLYNGCLVVYTDTLKNNYSDLKGG